MDDEMAMGGEAVCVDEEEKEKEEEVDFDYEYDAPRWIDFTREETDYEVEEAESWFRSAKSYPPSPFIVRLKFSMDLEASLTKSKDESSENAGVPSKGSTQVENKKGFGMDEAEDGRLKPKSKCPLKPSIPRRSTLLKPTASHLAKQNIPVAPSTWLVARLLRFKSPQELCVETDGSKRQKLEVGYLRRVAQLKHQALFSHKSPKKVRLTDINGPSKPKATIPKEPNLETAHRAQKHRSHNSFQPESNVTPIARMFKARPLNRKMLEDPSIPKRKKSAPQLPEFQVFHLRTSERAMQQSFDNITTMESASSSTHTRILNSRRANSIASKDEKSDPVYRFKARPLDKKILSCKGDVGVLLNSKQEAAKPKVFNSSSQQPLDPPTELFNKLSLTCEKQREDQRHLMTKGSKENVPTSSSQENRMANIFTGKTSRCGLKQGQLGGGRAPVEIKSHTTTSRSFKIH
ncbi:hypothetical protein Drorol1_Dr00002622 [Drosera rotundifolia]